MTAPVTKAPSERSRLMQVVLLATIALLVTVFLLHLFSLLSNSVDVPIDDARAYPQDDWSFALHNLFWPVNDTLATTGRLIDAVGVYLFAGNNIVIQAATSIAVLSGFVLVQSSLLRRFSVSTFALSLSIVTMVLMLQAGSYWGVQTLAYHQALPALGLSMILWFTNGDGPVMAGREIVAIFVLGTLSGLAYISGAIGLLPPFLRTRS